MTRFWTQTQAPSGNWVDNLGSDRLIDCQDQAIWLQQGGMAARVIERSDRVISEGPALLAEEEIAERAACREDREQD